MEKSHEKLKKQGYQKDSEEQRLNQLQGQIHDLEQDVTDRKKLKQHRITELEDDLEELKAERLYYQLKLHRIKEEWDSLSDLFDQR